MFWLAFIGVLIIGMALASGHPGFATKIANYTFFLFLAGVLFSIIKNE